jgi:hypothetical protein
MGFVRTMLRALSTGGLSLITKENDERDRISWEPNTCKCCGRIAQHYGSGGVGQDKDGKQTSWSCTREVCVTCLEGGCPCGGGDLRWPAAEVHDNCWHVKEASMVQEQGS